MQHHELIIQLNNGLAIGHVQHLLKPFWMISGKTHSRLWWQRNVLFLHPHRMRTTTSAHSMSTTGCPLVGSAGYILFWLSQTRTYSQYAWYAYILGPNFQTLVPAGIQNGYGCFHRVSSTCLRLTQNCNCNTRAKAKRMHSKCVNSFCAKSWLIYLYYLALSWLLALPLASVPHFQHPLLRGCGGGYSWQRICSVAVLVESQ